MELQRIQVNNEEDNERTQPNQIRNVEKIKLFIAKHNWDILTKPKSKLAVPMAKKIADYS